MSGRHSLSVSGPQTFLAHWGEWRREIRLAQGQYATEPIAWASLAKHRAPAHALTDDRGHEVTGPVVYLDALHGFVRETASMWGAHNATVIATGRPLY